MFDNFRPIRFSQVELGMEVFAFTRFASGTTVTYQGHVAAKGRAPDGYGFIHFRGAPFNPSEPYPVEVHLWEVMWEGPPPPKTPRQTIEEKLSAFAKEFSREIKTAW